MEITRRSFLGGAVVLAAAVALPAYALTPQTPTIHGDGIHDDTAGLQALLDGKPVYFVRDRQVVSAPTGQIRLSGGFYRTSDTIRINRPVHIDRLYMKAPADLPYAFMAEHDGVGSSIGTLHLETYSRPHT